MKLGIYMADVLPSAGGAHTWQGQILEALAEAAAESPHEFMLFGQDAGLAADWPHQASLPYVACRSSALKRVTAAVGGGLKYALDRARHPFSFVPYVKAEHRLWAEFLRRHVVDLVWYQSPGYLTMEVPYIFTMWDLQHRLQPQFPEVSLDGQWDYREHCYRVPLQRASFVVIGNAEGQDELERFYGLHPSRIRQVPFPTPRPRPPQDAALESQFLARLGLNEAPFFFYPAQFWPHKNHVGLLHALALAQSRHGIEAKLVLTGSNQGNLAHVREVARRLELDSRIVFPGYVSDDELATLYRHAAALVFPSYFGPDNLPPLEAFAYGCPVIAANCPGVELQLGEAALLVEPSDDKGMAEAMARLLGDRRLREGLIERGLAKAETWTPSHYLQAILRLVDEFAAYRRCWE